MLIDVFDVEHGACSVITAPNGRQLMVDCGHHAKRPWRPSVAFRGQAIEELVVSNFDEDHVSDLPGLMSNTTIGYITCNTSVSAAALAGLKREHGAGPGIQRLLRWMRAVEGNAGSGFPQYGDMTRTVFWNNYPYRAEDENNLSVVTFVEWSGFSMAFTGDLEVSGWRVLLENSQFRRALSNVNVLMASHHGRESGCCEDVFQWCSPQIVVMSDRDKTFNSQETTGWYARRCEGIRYNGGNRSVFTTRNDGDMRISVGPQRWSIATSI